MNYDYTVNNHGMNYGVVKGDHRIFFVKPGLGSDHVGYENKYLRMSYLLREKYGCSIIVASNPHDGVSHVNNDKSILEQYVTENSIESPELYFFGSSNGGIKGLELTDHGVVFRNMVLVNMPLMINYHKTKRYISAIPQTNILAVYGEYDPSVPYIPFIDGKFEHVKVVIIPRADHNFKERINEFIDISERLMRGSAPNRPLI